MEGVNESLLEVEGEGVLNVTMNELSAILDKEGVGSQRLGHSVESNDAVAVGEAEAESRGSKDGANAGERTREQ